MVRLSGGGGDWFWGESPVGRLNSGGEGMRVQVWVSNVDVISVALRY